MDLIYGTWSITTGYITCQHLFCYVIFPTQKLRNVSQKIVKRVQGTTLWFEKADWSRRIEKTTKTINQVINGRRIICHIYFPNMSIQKLNQSLKAFAQSREISVTIAFLIYTLVYEWCLNFRLKLSGWIKPKKYPGENTYSWGNLPPPVFMNYKWRRCRYIKSSRAMGLRGGGDDDGGTVSETSACNSIIRLNACIWLPWKLQILKCQS